MAGPVRCSVLLGVLRLIHLNLIVTAPRYRSELRACKTLQQGPAGSGRYVLAASRASHADGMCPVATR